MPKTYYTYRSSGKFPLNVRFTCPHCGAENVYDYSFEAGASETYSGSARINKTMLSQKLEKEAQHNANERAKTLTDDYRHGRGLMNPANKPAISFIICQKCGTAQVPACCKDQKSFGTRNGCLIGILIWLAVIAAYIVSLITLLNSGVALILLTLGFCAITAAIIVFEFRYEKKRTRQSASDPAVMKEYYNAVINDRIEFDFTQYGLGIVRVGEAAKQQ